jgi:hypothetical protein
LFKILKLDMKITTLFALIGAASAITNLDTTDIKKPTSSYLDEAADLISKLK